MSIYLVMVVQTERRTYHNYKIATLLKEVYLKLTFATSKLLKLLSNPKKKSN